jgi:MoaA/NifB/PqqE/SkfB family radical SAM enzyme
VDVIELDPRIGGTVPLGSEEESSPRCTIVIVTGTTLINGTFGGVVSRLKRMPRRARRCDIVEEGSAFASWDGGVHPCYFLWHRYSCHVGGLAKPAKPVSFGNLADHDLIALWARPPARAFREAVRRYDYPFCYDCTVALCDYQQDEDFTEDRYISTVPCGACLWSTGIFQCLR